MTKIQARPCWPNFSEGKNSQTIEETSEIFEHPAGIVLRTTHTNKHTTH